MLIKLNKSIPLFGKEHNQLQANILSFVTGSNVKRFRLKRGGYLFVTIDDYNQWSKNFKNEINEIEEITPSMSKNYLIDLGVDIEHLKEEMQQSDSLLF